MVCLREESGTEFSRLLFATIFFFLYRPMDTHDTSKFNGILRRFLKMCMKRQKILTFYFINAEIFKVLFHKVCIFTIYVNKECVLNILFPRFRRHDRVGVSTRRKETFVYESRNRRRRVSRGQNPRTSVAVPWHELWCTVHYGRRSRFVWGRIDLRAAIETRESRERFLVSPYGERQMCTRVPVPISSLFCPSRFHSDSPTSVPR